MNTLIPFGTAPHPCEASPASCVLVDLYLRLSDAPDEGGTFEDREKRLRAGAAARGWTVRRVVIENDEMGGDDRTNASAFKRRRIKLPNGQVKLRVYRPGFRSILEDMAAGHVHALLAEDLDRAMRDPRDLEDLIDVVEWYRLWADSLSGSLRLTNGGTDGEITMARVLVSMANKASRDTARRVADARKRNAERGKWGGGRRPFGFKADGVTIDKAEAAVIVWAAESVLAGVPLRQLARTLRARDVPTVTGRPWTAETLRDILLRPRNAGIMVYRPEAEHRRGNSGRYTKADELRRAPWDPIVPEDIWRTVHARLTDPNRSTAPGPAERWLGSGLYHCACGALMEVTTGGRTPRYRCRTRDRKLSGVQHTTRNVAATDAHVIATVIEILTRPEALDIFVPPADVDKVDIGAARVQLALLRERGSVLGRDYALGLIDRSQMLAGSATVKAETVKIEKMLARHTGRSPLAGLVGAADVRAAWKALPLGMQREVVRKLVKVTILPTARVRQAFDPASVGIEFRGDQD